MLNDHRVDTSRKRRLARRLQIEMPSAIEITSCLRSVVRVGLAKGDTVTVNTARAQAELELKLDQGFFKNDESWKSKSKEIIQQAVEDADEDDSHVSSTQSVPKRPHDPSAKPPATSKRRKTLEKDERDYSAAAELVVSQDTSISDSDSAGEHTTAQANVPPRDVPESRRTDEIHEPQMVDDESDTSSLIDQAPSRKTKRRKQNSAQQPAKRKKPSISQGKDLTPDEEMIKTLQSQLLKCGIRKLWHRELSGCHTDKEKIKHLKRMLEDVGMVGRFSAAKAEQIRETRELAAELEAAQEFERSFGTDSTADRAGRSRRPRAGHDKRTTRLDSESDSDGDEAAKVITAGAATGLVDFGDSGDEGSD